MTFGDAVVAGVAVLMLWALVEAFIVDLAMKTIEAWTLIYTCFATRRERVTARFFTRAILHDTREEGEMRMLSQHAIALRIAENALREVPADLRYLSQTLVLRLLDRRANFGRRVLGGPETDEAGVDFELGRRLRSARTVVVFAVPTAVLIATLALMGVQAESAVADLIHLNWWLVILAAGIHYVALPVRGLRWTWLMRWPGFRLSLIDATDAIFLNLLVNCVVPAKLGDVYRAYVLKSNAPRVSVSRAFGAVFIERIYDLVALLLLWGVTAMLMFRGAAAPMWWTASAAMVVISSVLAMAAMTHPEQARNVTRLVRRLHVPGPRRIGELWDKLLLGVLSTNAYHSRALVWTVSLAIWLSDATRLVIVVSAFGLSWGQFGPEAALFISISAVLLSALPFTPAGIGFVEVFYLFVLTQMFGISASTATAILLVDRGISLLSVIVIGSVNFARSPLVGRRGLVVRVRAQ